MRPKISLLLFLGGVLLIGLTSLLPIEPDAVRALTIERLARENVQSLLPEGAPTPFSVRWATETSAASDTSDKVDPDDLMRPVFAPSVVKTDADGKITRVPAFVVADDPKAPELLLKGLAADGQVRVAGSLGEQTFTEDARVGDWLALLPPLVALILAVAYRKVVPALLLAVLSGALVMRGFNPLTMLWSEARSLAGVLPTLFGSDIITVDGYLGGVLTDLFNLKILAFTSALVGLVAVVSRMGGTRGLVNLLSPLARGPRSAQVVTGLMGTAIFFDDYANTVVVGTTGQSLTDSKRLSREKLAYIVDSTSAPVAGIALISTWIGYEVGLFDSLLGTLAGVPDMPSSGYAMFLEILPLRFYCFFALTLVFLGAWLSRDLGPMYVAERRVRLGGPVVPQETLEPVEATELEKPGVRPRAYNAIIPIGVVLGTTLAWILAVGTAQLDTFSFFSLADWKVVMDAASDEMSSILLYASLIGSGVALLMAMGQGLLTPKEAFGSYAKGITSLAEAGAILILAWSIKAVCDDLGTGTAIVALVGDSLPPILLPLVVFVVSGAVAFATGTSWGTMALVLPVAAPLAATLSGEPLIVLACLGAVLDGAIWGDHCSPISDTTVLSSTACGCPHLAHVRTQLPYAFLAMFAAGVAGYFGVVVGLPVWLAYILGVVIMAAGLLIFGKDPNAGPEDTPAAAAVAARNSRG